MTAHWLDSHRLDETQRAELTSLLPKNAAPDQIERFLTAVAESVDDWEKTRPKSLVSERRDRLCKVDAAARRLRAALAELERDADTLRTLKAFFQAAVNLSDPTPRATVSLRDRQPEFDAWVDYLVDDLINVSLLADHTAAQYRASKEPMTQIAARALANQIVWNYRTTFDRLPPKSDWFYTFVEAVARIADATLGRKLINDAIDNHR
jgi:hypothetical protein